MKMHVDAGRRQPFASQQLTSKRLTAKLMGPAPSSESTVSKLAGGAAAGAAAYATARAGGSAGAAAATAGAAAGALGGVASAQSKPPAKAKTAPKPAPEAKPKAKPKTAAKPAPEAKPKAKPKTAAKPDPDNWIMRNKRNGTAAVIAHRGNIEHGDAPNSIKSLNRAAADKSSDAVEMDIQRLGDGTMIVYHDGDDPKITGNDLKKMKAADLAKHPNIPTLDEWTKRAGKLDMNVMAEFKSSGYEADALAVLQRHLAPDKLAVMSFDPDAIRGVHELDPSIPVALVVKRGEKAPSPQKQVDKLGFKPDFIEIVRKDINEKVISDMTKDGIGIIVGKEDAREQAALLKDPRISGIITNQPTQAAGLR